MNKSKNIKLPLIFVWSVFDKSNHINSEITQSDLDQIALPIEKASFSSFFLLKKSLIENFILLCSDSIHIIFPYSN